MPGYPCREVPVPEERLKPLSVPQTASIVTLGRGYFPMGHGRIVFEGIPAELKANQAVRREWLEV